MSKIYDLYSPDQRKIDSLKRRIKGYQKMEKDLQKDIRKTNNKNRELQQENKKLKEQLANDIDRYEDTISYQLGFDKGKEYLQQRIDKAIKYIEEMYNDEYISYGDKAELLLILKCDESKLDELLTKSNEILNGGENNR